MTGKTTIKRIAVLILWILVLAALTMLLIAAQRRQQADVCTEMVILIEGASGKLFITRNDVKQMVEKALKGSPTKKPVTDFRLAKLESVLEKNDWVRNAELYFDTRNVLYVHVEEREPVARVFTTEGKSFYIDTAGHRMSLMNRMTVRVPVVTGFPSARKLGRRDSLLLKEVSRVSAYVYAHPFWNAQVGQIDITPERQFEMIPLIGDHVIRLGNSEDLDRKLGHLLLFYQKVTSRTGFTKYSVLDVRFRNQVVAVKKEAMSKVDSVQLQKNIEELMQKNNLHNMNSNPLPAETAMNTPPVQQVQRQDSVPVKTNPNPSEKPRRTAPARAAGAQKQQVQPKAVMQRRA
ncbi:MAG TPA: hypothetical protein VFZ78_02600 [Flavisolibacter sp.]